MTSELGRDNQRLLITEQAKALIATIPSDRQFDINPWKQDVLTDLLSCLSADYERRGSVTEAFATFLELPNAGMRRLLLSIDARDSSRNLQIRTPDANAYEIVNKIVPAEEAKDILLFASIHSAGSDRERLKGSITSFTANWRPLAEPQKFYPL